MADLMSELAAWTIVVLFTVFMPLTAVTFRFSRLKQKRERLQRILERLGTSRQDASTQAAIEINVEYSSRDYLLPVSFMAIVCAIGSYMLVFGAGANFIDQVNIILEGGIFPEISETNGGLTIPDALRIHQHQAVAVGSWAFLGAFIWCMQNVLRRMVMVDLPPTAYLSMSVRIILAIFVALVIFHGMDLLFAVNAETGSITNSGLPALAFVIGTIPQRWLSYLRSRMNRLASRHLGFSKDSPTGNEMLPLDKLEGMNSFHVVRLGEIGIDNSQNLADSTLDDLVLKTPYGVNTLIDWVGQAKLHTRFRDDLDKLRKAGVRTIFDFVHIMDDENNRTKLSEQSSIELATLELAYTCVRRDKYIELLLETVDKLYEGESAILKNPGVELKRVDHG